MKLPEIDKSVIAVITSQGSLGLSIWHEVVFHDGDNWKSYAESPTFKDSEQVTQWAYCDDVLAII